MAQCNCGGKSGGNGDGRRTDVLFYSCSGGANVAEVADRACRDMMAEGLGQMACLAGVAAEIPEMVQAARGAKLNIIIDGCDKSCARRVFDRAGLTNYVQIQVTDLGFAKSKVVRATDEQVADTVARAVTAIESA